uniref:HMG box domain-containing protein n=1 Tax=Corethron hystrix TaxID=216773 RepID=A0A6U5FYY9_9STRA|mmetsp:Transcript_24883/g.57376  ORF Transcript_24883/g.57376 Transcript_24883/m.57376 type:complete len:337 (+) Transcript_24883:1205-2215(+)
MSYTELIQVPTEDFQLEPKKRRKRTSATYKKAPQAPKRSKSPYICFSTVKHKEIKDTMGPDAKVSDVAKKVAQVWRNLTDEEKKHWELEAEKDKQRYQEEKANYTGPWKIPSKRVKKDEGAPKRPMSSFLYYAQKMRPLVKEQNPEKRNTDISKVLGEMWKNCSEEERNIYVKREAEERERYKLAISAWDEKQAEKIADEEKVHIDTMPIDMSGQSPQMQYGQYYDPNYMIGQHQSMNPYMQYPQMQQYPPSYGMYPSQNYGYYSYPPMQQQHHHHQQQQQQQHNYGMIPNAPPSPPSSHMPPQSQSMQQNYMHPYNSGYVPVTGPADHHGYPSHD